MMSFEEVAYDTQSSLEELLKHFGNGDMKNMPNDLPPVAQTVWKNAQEILAAMDTPEFEELTD